jgi:hypothetical protein
MHIPGLGNSIYAIFSLVFLFLILRREIDLGTAFITIPVFLVGIAAPYYIRNWLVSIYPTSPKLMNGLLVLWAVFARLGSPKG